MSWAGAVLVSAGVKKEMEHRRLFYELILSGIKEHSMTLSKGIVNISIR